MQHLFTGNLRYGLERQKMLQGEERRERLSLSDGRWPDARQWFHGAGEWLVDQLAYVGQHLPCIDNELACDTQFIG
jgi:hypothetical protein